MLMNKGENLSFLDLLSVLSFIIGYANYEENVDQSAMQETVNKAVKDIHNHLAIQDAKLNKILEVISSDNKRNI